MEAGLGHIAGHRGAGILRFNAACRFLYIHCLRDGLAAMRDRGHFASPRCSAISVTGGRAMLIDGYFPGVSNIMHWPDYTRALLQCSACHNE